MPWPPPLSARWTALALFLFALALHLFVAIGGLAIQVDFKAVIVADELVAILGAPLIFALLLRLDLREAFSLRSSHWSHYVMAGITAIPLQIFGGALMELVIESLPSSEMWRELIESSLETMMQTQSAAGFAVLLLGGVVLAAICEELLFRGLMTQLLARGGRWRTAAVVSALLFAVFHLDPIGMLPRTLMGLYFALLVWRSGSIFPAMLAHGANNLLAFAAQPFASADAVPPTLAQAGMLAAGSGLVFGALVYAYTRYSPDASSHEDSVSGDPAAA